MSTDPSRSPERPLTPGEALANLFLDNADRGANHANDELVAALLQRAREIQALADHPDTRTAGEDDVLTGGNWATVRPAAGDDPELVAAIRRAEACGFQFILPRPGAAWWGERATARWRDIVYLDPTGPCNAARSGRGPDGPQGTDQVTSDALTVLHTVCERWPV